MFADQVLFEGIFCPKLGLGTAFAFYCWQCCSARREAIRNLGPQPPCGDELIPVYPGLDDLAIVKSRSKSDFGRDWKPSACTGWAEVGFTTLVTIAARFRPTSEAVGLLRNIGAISELAGMRYWSTTHKQWQTLIVDAHALTNSQSGQRREDFTPEEMKEGKVLYYVQADNLSGKAIYRMHIIEASASRLVFDVENVSTVRYFFIPILHSGDLQSMYFWIVNRIKSGATTASCAQGRTPTG